MIRKVLIIIISSMSLNYTLAEQLFQAKTGQTVVASISEKDLTRIQVKGFSIVKALTSSPIKIKKETATGQIYILPDEVKGTFNLFIIDSAGNNFNLLLTSSKNRAGDSIVIMPDQASVKALKQNKNTKRISSFYERSVINLIQAMYLGQSEDENIGFQVNQEEAEILMWKKLKVILKATYSNQILSGYILEVTNNGTDSVLLSESEFYKNSVLAVAIDLPKLKVGESTKVFVVKENRDQEAL